MQARGKGVPGKGISAYKFIEATEIYLEEGTWVCLVKRKEPGKGKNQRYKRKQSGIIDGGRMGSNQTSSGGDKDDVFCAGRKVRCKNIEIK